MKNMNATTAANTDTAVNKDKNKNKSKNKSGGFIKEIKTNYNLYLMLLPAVIGFFIFCYMPIYGLKIAFMDYDIILGFDDSPWVLFKHFEAFFKDPFFTRILSNTVLLGLYNLLWSFWPPILFAILLNELKWTKLKKLYQSISYLPHFIAVVVIVGMMMQFSTPSGIFNQIATAFGGEPIAFFNDPKYFRTMYIASGVWQGMGYASILYLSTLSGVDTEQYEAAYIDGANRLQRIWHITVPAIMPTITILLVLNSASIINVGFEKVYLMQNPAIYETGDVIQTYVYRYGIVNQNYSYGAAVGLFNSAISLALVALSNTVSSKLKQNSIW